MAPDTAVFALRISGRRASKEACARAYAASRSAVKAALAKIGIAEEVKTSRYACYARATRKKGTIVGYDYSAYGKLRLPRATTDVTTVWEALQSCGDGCESTLWFELTDERACMDALLRRAVQRARADAETLAAAAGACLAGIRRIAYNSESPYSGPLMMGADGAAPGSFGDDPDFEPTPEDVSCHVDVE